MRPGKNTSRNTKNDRLDVSAFNQKLLDGVSKKIVVSFQNRPAKTLPCPPENTSANVRKNHWRQLVNFLTPPHIPFWPPVFWKSGAFDDLNGLFAFLPPIVLSEPFTPRPRRITPTGGRNKPMR